MPVANSDNQAKNTPKILWHWYAYDELSKQQLTEIYRQRQAVFIVEQDCPYMDIDGLDPVSWHLSGWNQDNPLELMAYLRVTFPGHKYSEPSIGRVLSSPSARRFGLGKCLMQTGIERTLLQYPGQKIRISAQQYLLKFYQQLGFEPVSEPYDEDGIAHIEMLLSPQ